MWRTTCNNGKVLTTQTTVDTTGRDSFDIEISKKVAMTIACLIGAYSKKDICAATGALLEFAQMFEREEVIKNQKIFIILFLEGNFNSKVRNKMLIMKNIEDSIKKKLHWLNCKVSVVDSSTYHHDFFDVSKDGC